MNFYYDCSMTPTYIDTQMATRYAAIGHPLLLEDPTFQTPVDKRNCKSCTNTFILYFNLLNLNSNKRKTHFHAQRVDKSM